MIKSSGFRPGDHVMHKPSGQNWLLAKVEKGLCWAAGWPITPAKEEELDLIAPATDAFSAYMIENCRRLPETDPRWMPRQEAAHVV